MRTQWFGASRFVVLRLDPGEDVLLSLRSAVSESAMGGYLEEGCRVLTFAVVMMAEAPDVDLTG